MSKLIGKPFRCRTSTKTRRQPYGVCECDCGAIYVSCLLKIKGTETFRLAAKECHLCNGRAGEGFGTDAWEFRLRERIIRHQLWYKDRTGSRRCADCHKHRRESHSAKGPSDRETALCRECEALQFLQQAPVETRKCSEHYLYHYHQDQDNPGFENMIRMIEDA